MVIAFQIVLLIVILSSFSSVREGKNESLQEQSLAIFFASLASFIASVLWL